MSPKLRLFLILGLWPILESRAEGLDWRTGRTDRLPPGWECGGKGEGKILASFGGEKHPVIEMKSMGDGLVLHNYRIASAYQGEVMGRMKIQFTGRAIGCVNFAMDGGGGRGGCGVYFTDAGALEVGDERGARTRLLSDYQPGVWYEIRAYFSMVEETWDAEVIEADPGKTRSSLKGLGWVCPAVRLEKACAGMALSVWSPGTVYVSEAEIKPLPVEAATKRKAAGPLLGVPMTARPPQIDGTLGKDEWTDAAHIGSLCVLNTGAMDPKPCDVFITYDEKNFHLAFHQPLRNSREVQPSYTKRDDNISMDDCFEFLLAPNRQRDDKHRIHFIGNAANAIYDDQGGNKTWNGNWTYRTSVTDTAWEGELAILLSELALPTRNGDQWAFNVGRSLLSHDAMLSTTYAVWAMPAKAALGFMDTANYGILQFRGRQPWAALERMTSLSGNQFQAAVRTVNPTDQPVEFTARVEDNSAILGALAEKKIPVAPRSAQTVEIATEFPNRWRLILQDGSPPGPILRQEAINPMANQPVLAVRPYPLQNFLEIDLDLSHLRRMSGNEFKPSLRVLSRDRKKTWLEQPLGNVTEKLTRRIPIAKLPVGDYLAEVKIAAADGKAVAEVEKPFVRGDPQPKWYTHPVAKDDLLLHPFPPVTVKDTKGARRVMVWGRQHDFGAGGLPQQVLVTGGAGVPPGGVQLLSEPVQLVARQSGQEKILNFERTKGFLGKPTRAAWNSRSRLPDGRAVTLRTTVEFDGLIRLDVTLPAGAELDRLDLRVPMRSVTHYYTSVMDQYSSEAGRLPKTGFHTSFRPLVWLGDMERGCTWACEMDRDWQPADYGKGIEMAPAAEGQGATLLVHWIGRTVTLTRDRNYTFFLQVSPVKPLPVGHESWRTGKDYAWPWFYVFNDALTQPMVHRPDFLPHVRAEHARGCAVLPYFFPTSMKATARDCLAYKNEWGHPSDVPDVLAEQNMPPDMKMNIDTSWTDYFMAGLDDFARDFGIDGVYYDTTGPMRRSMTDENGERYTFWPLLGCREFHRRTAVIFEKRRGPGNYILFNHMSDNMVMPTLSFFTIAFDGEQYNRVPPGCADYTALLPFERAEVIDNPEHWGLPCQFLPEIPIRKTPEARRTNRLATDSLLAMLLPLGDSWWGEGPMLYARQKQVTDAMEKFGVADAAFHPYWRQKEIVAPDGVVVTYYEKAPRRFVIVSNPGPERRSGAIRVTDRAPAACADALGETAPGLTDRELQLDLAPHTFRLLILEMAPATGSKSPSP